jgi:hypothetical protein
MCSDILFGLGVGGAFGLVFLAVMVVIDKWM